MEPTYTIAALYHFASWPAYRECREALKVFCTEHSIMGSLLLAEEGINGTVAGTRESIDHLLRYLRALPPFTNLEHKESFASTPPFRKMKVLLKKEIVALGVEGTDPTQCVGTYIRPEKWNELISRDDVILIDTRNDYEVRIGTFEGAINPDITIFRDFADYIAKHFSPETHPNVAMFCTGGIRCEKATSHLLNKGFKNVYHLQGGILRYFERIPESESMWNGECFVFDSRVSVTQDLQPGNTTMCFGCGNPVIEEDRLSPHYKKGMTCPHCYNKRSDEQQRRSLQKYNAITTSSPKSVVEADT